MRFWWGCRRRRCNGFCTEFSLFFHCSLYGCGNRLYADEGKTGKKSNAYGHNTGSSYVSHNTYVYHVNRKQFYLYDGKISGSLGEWNPCRGSGSFAGNGVFTGYFILFAWWNWFDFSWCRSRKSKFILYFGRFVVEFYVSDHLYEWFVYKLCICRNQYNCSLRYDLDSRKRTLDGGCNALYGYEPYRFRSVFDRACHALWYYRTFADAKRPPCVDRVDWERGLWSTDTGDYKFYYSWSGN